MDQFSLFQFGTFKIFIYMDYKILYNSSKSHKISKCALRKESKRGHPRFEDVEKVA
jgi:hypothetical protein